MYSSSGGSTAIGTNTKSTIVSSQKKQKKMPFQSVTNFVTNVMTPATKLTRNSKL